VSPEEPIRDGKYARVERERRFLLAAPPDPAQVSGRRRITDRYLTGTRLRLRRVERTDNGAVDLKLTQKLPAGRPGAVQGLITNTYLSEAEYDLLATLPGAMLSKLRVTVPPVVVDLFDPPLHGLVIAEREFRDDDTARGFQPPAEVVAEVTDDPRFTGGCLAQTGRADLLAWLAEYGIEVRDAPPATG
jgi:CYTH domain-containing protein